MSATAKQTLSKVMKMAWQFVRKNGYNLSQALKTAWANVKLHAALAKGVVKFHFTKVDGTIREAFGTLNLAKVPAEFQPKGERKEIPTTQTYFDTEKGAWRCYKKANLIY